VGNSAGGDGGGGNGGTNNRNNVGVEASPGATNTGGGGGGGAYYNVPGIGVYAVDGKPGGSGVVILRYSALARIIDRIDPGLSFTYSNDGTYHYYTFTAGAGNIIF
jgi:hypothetical protein